MLNKLLTEIFLSSEDQPEHFEMQIDDPNGFLDDELVYYTTSARGKPAITIGDIRFLVMTESAKKILWRCSFMQVIQIDDI